MILSYLFIPYSSIESSEPGSKRLKTDDDEADATEFRFSSLLQESVTEESRILLFFVKIFISD